MPDTVGIIFLEVMVMIDKDLIVAAVNGPMRQYCQTMKQIIGDCMAVCHKRPRPLVECRGRAYE